jgi:hypothetical protein
MDEQQWLNWTDREAMLQFIANQASNRKLRLFGCACLHQAWDWTDHSAFRRAVLVGERFVDGAVSEAELRRAFIVAWPNGWEHLRTAAICTLTAQQEWQLRQVRILAYEVVRLVEHQQLSAMKRFQPQQQADFLREIFGNPFRPPVFLPDWRTPDVLALAGEIHDERSFEHLPVLADALEDAGCGDLGLLAHFRRREGHLPGCWALDCVLGQG